MRPSSQRNARRGLISITARSKKSGSATRLPRNMSITGSFSRQSGRTRSQPAWRSLSSTIASPWIVARSNRSPLTAAGSVIESETFGFALMCSSLREKSTLDVR